MALDSLGNRFVWLVWNRIIALQHDSISSAYQAFLAIVLVGINSI